MKTTFEDFEKTTLYTNLVFLYKKDAGMKAGLLRTHLENFHLAIKAAFLVGHQLGMDEARAILEGEKDKEFAEERKEYSSAMLKGPPS